MRILGMMVMMMFLCVGAASAVTVNLTNGSSIQGDIIKQDAKSLQINVDGVTMTYYADEVKDIDGKSFTATPVVAAPPQAAVPAAALPAPAVVAEPAAAAVTVPAPAPVAAVAPPEAAASPVSTPVITPVPKTIDPEKKALILQFIDVFGTRQALTNNFELMVKQIAKDRPDEAKKIRQRVKVDEIIDHLLPIYDRNFSDEDLKAFIAFYGSPEGQKLIKTLPELMKESVQESIKYMEEKFPEVTRGQ